MSLSLSLAQATYELAEKIGVDESLSKTERFMRANNLEALLPKVREKINQLCDKEIKSGQISVKTVLPLPEEAKVNIKKAHNAPDAHVYEIIDPILLAGFISEYKGQSIDTSVQTIISKLHN